MLCEPFTVRWPHALFPSLFPSQPLPHFTIPFFPFQFRHFPLPVTLCLPFPCLWPRAFPLAFGIPLPLLRIPPFFPLPFPVSLPSSLTSLHCSLSTLLLSRLQILQGSQS